MAKRTPRSAKLPQSSLKNTLTVVKALSDLAGPSSAQVIAQQLGVSPAGGKFRTHVTSSKYYGFIEKKQGKLALTERGGRAVSDEKNVATIAKQEAIMSTAFRAILEAFSGRVANASTVAARLQDDWQVPPKPALELANNLMKSAEEAGIMKDNRIDAKVVESIKIDAPSVLPRQTVLKKPVVMEPPKTSVAQPSITVIPKALEQLDELPKSQPVTVNLNLDTSSWTPEQVAVFLKELRSH